MVPIANAAATKQLAFFEAETTKLRAEFTTVRNSQTPEPIVALEQQWWRLTDRIYTSPEFDDPAIRVLLHAELAVSRSWRMALSSLRARCAHKRQEADRERACAEDRIRRGARGARAAVRPLARAPGAATFSRISTSSSAAVGCSATVLSHCFFVSPAFTATAASWIISGASSPAMCTPNN